MRGLQLWVAREKLVCCRLVNSSFKGRATLRAIYRGKFEAAEEDTGSVAAAKVTHTDRQSFMRDITSNP